MYRVLVFLTIQFIFWSSVQASPKDSLRLEKRDGGTYIIHRVVKNESLTALAKRYGVAEAELLSNNPMVTEKVYAGQLLKVPVNTARYGNVKAPEVKALTASRLPLAQTLPSPTKTNSDPAQATIAAAAVPAKKETEKPEEIVKTSDKSNITGPNVIDFDSNKTTFANGKQKLEPQPINKSIATYKTYVVASPQSVQQVANTFSVDANDIIIANNLKNYKLKEGQKIKIPFYESASQTSTLLAAQTVAKPDPSPVKKQESKPEPEPEPEPEPKPKPEPKPEPKLEPKPKPKPELKTISPAIQASQTSEKSNENIKVAKSSTSLQGDSITKARKVRIIAKIAMLDSAYVHPDGASYVVFNYKQTDYQYDAYTIRLAEENAIELEHTNQRQGYGGKDVVHVVKRGETLQSIARKYRISATDIINWNGLLTYRVREGQELVINSARADVSPYQRTVTSKAKIPENAYIYEDVVKGLAFYEEEKELPGVYVNGVEKGKFIYILNRDNYRETFARVLGPMPTGMPTGTVIYLGNQAARELHLDAEATYVEMWFGVFKEDKYMENEDEAKAE